MAGGVSGHADVLRASGRPGREVATHRSMVRRDLPKRSRRSARTEVVVRGRVVGAFGDRPGSPNQGPGPLGERISRVMSVEVSPKQGSRLTKKHATPDLGQSARRRLGTGRRSSRASPWPARGLLQVRDPTCVVTQRARSRSERAGGSNVLRWPGDPDIAGVPPSHAGGPSGVQTGCRDVGRTM
jgi:hypothetical protein